MIEEQKLEATKLDIELRRIALEHRKLNFGFVKFLLGTVALGALSVIVNSAYQSREIRLRELNADYDYLGRFLEAAIDKDVEIRLRQASYISHVALNRDTREIWRHYCEILQKEKQMLEERARSLNEQRQRAVESLQALGTNVDARAERIVLAREIAQIREELRNAYTELDRRRYSTYLENYVDVFATLKEAERARNAQRFSEQRELLEKAARADDGSYDHYILVELANCARALRRFDEAVSYATRAVAITPDAPSAYIDLAIMQKNAGRIEEALGSLEKAHSLPADEATRLDIDLIIAGYRILSGDRDGGLAGFSKIEAAVRNTPSMVTNLAWFYAVAGEDENFYSAFERALEDDREGAVAWASIEADLDRFRDKERFMKLLASGRGRTFRPDR
jgi:tetratricopeptide (TPR) repeat protein